MPNGADNAKERFALGDLQSDALSELESTAAAHGHELRLLCSAKAGAREATFIHSKLLIVDDQLLSVGSANMTDRSMALDSELCLLWQAAPGSDLSRDIQRVRASLLAEHSGRDGNDWLQITGLVQRLDAWIAARATRLRACHFDPTSASPFKKAIFDPLGPLGTG
jgi:phosphatidylserine/phosphatidylglycerophosphate/cardiolipin synthase-like enzyme